MEITGTLLIGGKDIALTPEHLIVAVGEAQGGIWGLGADFFLTVYAYDFRTGDIVKLIDRAESPVGVKRWPFLIDDRAGSAFIVPAVTPGELAIGPWIVVQVDQDSYIPAWQAPEGHDMGRIITAGALDNVIFFLAEDKATRVNLATGTFEERDLPFEPQGGVWVESAETLLAVVASATNVPLSVVWKYDTGFRKPVKPTKKLAKPWNKLKVGD